MGVAVLTMAGRSQRFVDAGIHAPKWSLRVGDRSIFARAVDSILELRDAGWRLVVVARQDHATTAAFGAALGEIDWTADVVVVEETPPGQALSALAAAPKCGDEPIAIWNADTAILPGDEALALSGGNWLTLAQLPGDHWSFAALDDGGDVTRTTEKDRISPWASIGLYGFESAAVLNDAIERAPDRGTELYVAPLYNRVTRPVRSVCIPASRVAPLGTPAEIRATCARLGWQLPLELARV